MSDPRPLFMDIYSPKIVGWQVYETESSDLASEVMRDVCARENIVPQQVVMHSDNGSPMKGPPCWRRCEP
jgi:putative transposase